MKLPWNLMELPHLSDSCIMAWYHHHHIPHTQLDDYIFSRSVSMTSSLCFDLNSLNSCVIVCQVVMQRQDQDNEDLVVNPHPVHIYTTPAPNIRIIQLMIKGVLLKLNDILFIWIVICVLLSCQCLWPIMRCVVTWWWSWWTTMQSLRTSPSRSIRMPLVYPNSDPIYTYIRR